MNIADKKDDRYTVRDPKGVIPREDIKFYALQNKISLAEAISILVWSGLAHDRSLANRKNTKNSPRDLGRT